MVGKGRLRHNPGLNSPGLTNRDRMGPEKPWFCVRHEREFGALGAFVKTGMQRVTKCASLGMEVSVQ